MSERQYAEHLDYLEHIPMDVLKAIDATGQVAQGLERQDLSGELERLNILETPFYDRLNKIQATAYEHEYNVVTSRQDKIGYATYRDGGIPRTVELEIARRRTLPSLIGHRITITELAVATTRAGVQTAEQTARNEKMVAVMEETEYLLMHGNRGFGSTDFSSPQNLQFDGIENIVKRGAPQNILDLEGQPLSLAALWQAENKVYLTQGLARPSTVFMSPVDKINLQQSFYQISRVNTTADRMAGVLGADAQTYISAYGESELVTDRFLGDWHKFSALGFGSTGGEFARPAAPVIAAAPAAAAPTTAGTGLDAGTYQYAVKAANFNGESDALLTAPATVTAPATDGEITFTATVDQTTKWVIVYQSADGGASYQFLKKIPVHSTAVPVSIVINGYQTLVSPYGSFTYKQIPGTGFVAGVDFMTTMLASWIPLEQVPLPQTLNKDYAIRHVSSLFSRAPEFNFLIVNVGQENFL